MGELLILGFVLTCSIVGGIIGSQKNATVAGVVMGLMLGPLGVVAMFAIDYRPKCPYCNSRMNGEPIVCPSCRYDIFWRDGLPVTEDEAAAYDAEEAQE